MTGFFLKTAHAAGVIEDATPVSVVLINVMQFLLSIFAVLAIIGLVVSGFLYLLSSGDEKRAALAKKAALGSVIGIGIALSGIIIVRQAGSFF